DRLPVRVEDRDEVALSRDSLVGHVLPVEGRVNAAAMDDELEPSLGRVDRDRGPEPARDVDTGRLLRRERGRERDGAEAKDRGRAPESTGPAVSPPARRLRRGDAGGNGFAQNARDGLRRAASTGAGTGVPCSSRRSSNSRSTARRSTNERMQQTANPSPDGSG